MAPPAVAAAAWLAISGGHSAGMFVGLTGVTGFIVLVQIGPGRRHAHLLFSLGHWAFSFPAAIISVLALRWLAIAHAGGWQWGVVAVLVVVTVFITVLGAKSIARFVVLRHDLPRSQSTPARPAA